MGKWVYRRPYFRQPRTRLPLTRGHGLLVAAFFRRRANVRRRAWVRRRAPAWLAALSHGHNAHLAGIVRALRRQRRRPRVQRRLGVTFGVAAAAAAAGRVPALRVRQLRRVNRPKRVRRLRAPGTVEPPTPPTNKTGTVARFRRAVARNLDALRRRLRWKPRPADIPPIIVPHGEETVLKGRIAQPGMTRGRIVTGGM
jgi:hypothetical protein